MVITEKAPKGIMTSQAYEVEVLQGELWEKSDVYLTICPDGARLFPDDSRPKELQNEFFDISNGGAITTLLEKAYFTGFTADCETIVRVKINQDFDKVDVLGKRFTISGNVVTFSMFPDEKTIIRLGKDFGRHLCISCDKPIEIPNDENNLIELIPGIYNSDNCEYITLNKYGAPIFSVPDNTTVYLHRSAVINAAIYLENVHNVKIIGNGIVSTVGRVYGAANGFDTSPRYAPVREGAVPAVYVKTNSSYISIEGITLSCEFRGIVLRNSNNIFVDKVNIFTGCINGDGINMVNVQNVNIKDSLIISEDDCIAMFTDYDSVKFLNDTECKNPKSYTANVDIDNCILATTARAFCIGGHATGNKNPHDILENVYARNIYAFRIGGVASKLSSTMYWSGQLRILSQTEQHIRNIKFENIKVSQLKNYHGKLIHIEVRSSNDASYTESQGFRIENIDISNVEFFTDSDESVLPCIIKSPEEYTDNSYGVDGVSIKNVLIDSKKFVNTDEFLSVSGTVRNLSVD